MKMIPLATAVLALSAGSAIGPAFAEVMSPAEYVTTAGASDLYELRSSQLVAASTADAKIKSFASMMVEDHTASSAKVKAAAAKSGIAPSPPKLTPVQNELIAELQALNGADRDARYVAQQKAAHNQALAVQKGYAADGAAPALKATAAGIVPVVEHHIEMLKAM